MTTRDALWQEIRAREDELLELCASCVRTPSPNPPGSTAAIAELIRERLDELGIGVEVYEPLRDAPNVVATIGGDSPNLVVNCHIDSFPPADGDWTHGGPFSGAVVDGRVYGTGASDMKASVGVALFLAGLLKPHEHAFAGRVTFVFVSDEETGGRYGSSWLLENVPAVRGDACLIGDQCGVDRVAVAEKGICFVTLQTRGTSSHAAYGNADSAIHRLLRVLDAARTLEGLDGVTANVGVIAGGGSPNLVADHATARLDIRLPPGLTGDRLLAELDARIRATGESCTVEVDLLTDPTETAPDEPIVRSVVEAATAATGGPVRPFTRVGASDARLFRGAGIPTVVYGPGANNMGGVDEFATSADVVTSALVHGAVMLDFLNGHAGPREP